jgi:hypothetical protein
MTPIVFFSFRSAVANRSERLKTRRRDDASRLREMKTAEE